MFFLRKTYFLEYGCDDERCVGDFLVRFDRSTLVRPCFECQFNSSDSVCPAYNEFWAMQNDDGMYIFSKKDMPSTLKRYEAGTRNNIWRIPGMSEADELYSFEIADIKATFEKTGKGLSASWPDLGFRDFLDSVMIKPGVVSPDAGTSHNPLHRLRLEQDRIVEYAKAMVPLWLHIRALTDLEELMKMTAELAQQARTIEGATRNKFQQHMPHYPIFCGALTIADVMLAGFKFHCRAVVNAMQASCFHRSLHGVYGFLLGRKGRLLGQMGSYGIGTVASIETKNETASTDKIHRDSG